MRDQQVKPNRRLDIASLSLALVGLVFGAFAYWLVVDRGYNAILLAPSIVALTIGLTHITKLEAPRPG